MSYEDTIEGDQPLLILSNIAGRLFNSHIGILQQWDPIT